MRVRFAALRWGASLISTRDRGGDPCFNLLPTSHSLCGLDVFCAEADRLDIGRPLPTFVRCTHGVNGRLVSGGLHSPTKAPQSKLRLGGGGPGTWTISDLPGQEFGVTGSAVIYLASPVATGMHGLADLAMRCRCGFPRFGARTRSPTAATSPPGS